MSKPDNGAGVATDTARQAKANKTINAHHQRMKLGHPTSQQKAQEEQLMNEMRGNRASLDVIRAMHEYDDEHDDNSRSKFA